MKRAVVALLLLMLIPLGGCTHFEQRLSSVALSTRQDVFHESTETSPIPAGYAGLKVVASLKTHEPGRYLFEKSPHGTPDYLLLLNVDGQAEKMVGFLSEEEIPHRAKRDPEAGRGIRYIFQTNLHVKSGPHKIAFALPADKVIVEYEVSLKENSQNLLEVVPMYGKTPEKQRAGFYNVTSFLQGIKSLQGYINGNRLKVDD